MMRKRAAFIVLLLCLTLTLPACRGFYDDRVHDHHVDVGASCMRNKGSVADSAVLTIVIDPGHGGKDVGATGAGGRYEKDFTLSVARKVMERLEREPRIRAFMTRTDDRFISQRGLYRTEFTNTM